MPNSCFWKTDSNSQFPTRALSRRRTHSKIIRRHWLSATWGRMAYSAPISFRQNVLRSMWPRMALPLKRRPPSRPLLRRLPKRIEVRPLTNQALPVQVENVSKVYGRTAAVRNLSLELQAGKFYVLRGENGAGKSTLLRMIAGLNEPTEGSILIYGLKTRDALHQMGYMAHA